MGIPTSQFAVLVKSHFSLMDPRIGPGMASFFCMPFPPCHPRIGGAVAHGHVHDIDSSRPFRSYAFLFGVVAIPHPILGAIVRIEPR